MVDLLGLEVFALLALATIVTAFETGAVVANTSRAKMVTEITGAFVFCLLLKCSWLFSAFLVLRKLFCAYSFWS